MHLVTAKTLDSRRQFLRQLAAGGAFFSVAGLYAEALTVTPDVTQGPFYPLAKNIPLDKDNDLVQLDDHLTPAKGPVTWVAGRILARSGSPIKGALVELWHADAGGNYTYAANAPRNPQADPNFAGFGQFLTGADGVYKFRTVKAGLYQGRTRHFHFGVTVPGQKSRRTTQLFWNEVPLGPDGQPWEVTNDNDNVLSGVSDPVQRASLIRDFRPVAGGVAGETETTWDIVMDLTPAEPAYPESPGGALVVVAEEVRGEGAGKPRYRVAVPAYKGYSYEVYANPTMGKLGWAALPFSIGSTGAPDRNIHTATEDGRLDLFIEKPSSHGFYYVAFRLPGANTGTPGGGGRGGPRGGPGGPGGPRGRRDGPPSGGFGPGAPGGGFPPPPE